MKKLIAKEFYYDRKIEADVYENDDIDATYLEHSVELTEDRKNLIIEKGYAEYVYFEEESNEELEDGSIELKPEESNEESEDDSSELKPEESEEIKENKKSHSKNKK